mmetsp:Transcript_16871/g.25962  ORF Transcript_16871/g.25962 Transcript_16871/m.25962 type:complete len:97 (-) Transcript_16871:42-332(-)|eukprot:CAMPEP_0170511000 /NCGR_PEP_ID=MMETSP0208-20121228/66069_1 /TAXON_ID=197538 /ORGANISM="Strombidium inclinatum, Strain S3" /LENGTH=96 /DNA_ID=CAMNT_0010794501 /DNA_START=991 /DNA_END=1281 /DNA_ORIENTATION=-
MKSKIRHLSFEQQNRVKDEKMSSIIRAMREVIGNSMTTNIIAEASKGWKETDKMASHKNIQITGRGLQVNDRVCSNRRLGIPRSTKLKDSSKAEIK